jgi:hypothetical protein
LTLVTANIRKRVDSSKTETITTMIMTMNMAKTTIIVSNIQSALLPRFLQTLWLFYRVSFAASVRRKLSKAQNFVTDVAQLSK